MRFKFPNGKTISIAGLCFLIIYVLFCIADFSASEQTGFRDSYRGKVHIYILLVTVFLFLYFVINIRKIKLTPIMSSMILLAIWTVVVNAICGVAKWTILVQANMSIAWILSYLFFEHLGGKDRYTNSDVKMIVSVLMVFFIAATVFYFFDMLVRLKHFPVLTMSYYVLALVPWIMADKQKSKNTFLILIAAVVFMSMKRGAIVALILMIIVDELIDVTMKRITIRHFISTVLIVLLIVSCLIVADKATNGFLSSRFSLAELESGSGRRKQFALVLNELKSRGMVQLIFGVGCERCVKVFGTGIHNEWLSFLYNYGFIGLLLYANLFLSMVKDCKLATLKMQQLSSPTYMMLVLIFVLSMISTAYGGYWGLWLFGFWGYINARIQTADKVRIANEYL